MVRITLYTVCNKNVTNFDFLGDLLLWNVDKAKILWKSSTFCQMNSIDKEVKEITNVRLLPELGLIVMSTWDHSIFIYDLKTLSLKKQVSSYLI